MREVLPVDELEALADEDVGEALRRTRTYYKKSLADVEKALRIRASQIDAIERGDMTQLPGRVYAIGFVRSYAEFLELDGAKVVQLFKAQYMDGQDKSDLSFHVPASETRTPDKWLVVFTFLISIFFVLWWVGYSQKIQENKVEQVMVLDSVPEDIKSHVDKEILSASILEAEEIVVDPIEAPASSEPIVEDMGEEGLQKSGVILKILGDSWVEIKDGEGKVLVSNVLEQGDEYFVPDSPGLSMSLGNAANVEIVVDGRVLKPLGKDGDVRRGIPLNTTYLKTLEFVVEEPLPVENDSELEQQSEDVILPPEE